MEYKYTITLEDGRQLTGLGMNGDNFVSMTNIDESIFVNNLGVMTVSDGVNETVYNDVEFIQQMLWADGTWYLAFRELTPLEKTAKLLAEMIEENDNSVTDIQLALAEIYEMITGGE